MSFQFQIDILNGVTIGAKLADQLLRACVDDDVQPLVFSPAELLGQWLMVDGKRIKQAEDALSVSKYPIIRTTVPMRLSKSSTAEIIRRNLNLTSTFAFVACCSVGYDSLHTGELLYEIMNLKGDLRKYPITPRLVCDFVDCINGHRDLIPGETMFDVYDVISKGAWYQTNQQGLRIDDFYSSCGIRNLAKLLYEVIDTMHDTSFSRIHLHGSRTGILIASILSWLYPAKTKVFVNNFLIYPPTLDSESDTEFQLVIQFREPRAAQGPTQDAWEIDKWKGVDSIKEVLHLGEAQLGIGLTLPMSDAFAQIGLQKNSVQVLETIGHLAGSLVVLATERGAVSNFGGTKTATLDNICSTNYLQAYPTIMQKFGWKSTDTERQRIIVEIMELRMDEGRVPECNFDSLFSWISSCQDIYFERYHETMFPIENDETQNRDIVQHAIGICVQALQLSLFFEQPKNAMYWPMTPIFLRNYTQLFSGLLFGKNKPQYWTLRELAVSSFLPNTENISRTDLAWARNGYVVYSTALEDYPDMTHKRTMACIKVVPGLLRSDKPQGKYTKIFEGSELISAGHFASVSSGEGDSLVQLFSQEGEFTGVPEKESHNTADIVVRHMVANDEMKRTINIVTFLQPRAAKGSSTQSFPNLWASGIPACWWRSTNAIVFATPVDKNTTRLQQLKLLAEEWDRTGLLGVGLQWYLVGQKFAAGTRYITRTMGDEHLRFFQAGNVPRSYNIFIRKKMVPLTHCVKEAIDLSQDNPYWVIIS